jgi:hypothetical protein
MTSRDQVVHFGSPDSLSNPQGHSTEQRLLIAETLRAIFSLPEKPAYTVKSIGGARGGVRGTGRQAGVDNLFSSGGRFKTKQWSGTIRHQDMIHAPAIHRE